MDTLVVESAAPTQVSSSPIVPCLGPVSHGATIRGWAAGANAGLPFGRFGPMFDLPPCPPFLILACASWRT